MIANTFAPPDITLTLDPAGVIRTANVSEALSGDQLDKWRGRPWGETLEPGITAQVRQMIEDMRVGGASSCFQVDQTLPSGRALRVEYTTFSLGVEAGFIAIGKNVQAIADLQSRLRLAQEEREREYWKFREIETRYKTLFDASVEASVVVRVTNLRIVEANLAATKSLGLLPGPEFYPDMGPRDRRLFEAMLEKVRENGRAPGIAIGLQSPSSHWSLRASLMTSDAGSFYLFQMSPLGGAAQSEMAEDMSVERIVKRLPDGFTIVTPDGVVQSANDTFLDLTQTGAEATVIGRNIKHWLAEPGADFPVMMGLMQRHGSVRLMTTRMSGDLGSNTSVEISAVGNKPGNPDFIGLLIRDVTTRQPDDVSITRDFPDTSYGAGGAGDASLERLVRDSTVKIERKTIERTLEICRGNRTAAAKRLGMSRQSLHSKLKKYDLTT